MPLTLHRSNRLEALAVTLAGQLRASPRPPLEAERIVVASFGLRRWLSHRLADHLGVAMHFAFLFPAEFVQSILSTLSPGQSPSTVYRRDVLPWRIHAVLPGLLGQPDFSLLKNYAQDDPLKRWQLAAQLAAVFDRYIAYRPELLLRWEQGKPAPEERWQATLWRALSRGELHAPALMRDFVASQRAPQPDPDFADLPLFQVRSSPPTPPVPPLGRFSIFGPTTLPPFYLQILDAIAPHADLHVYLLAPTSEYWGDVLSEREQTRVRRWMARRGADPARHPFSAPHPLLASLGKIGRDFHEALLELSPTAEFDCFQEDEAPATVLRKLQRSILLLDTETEPQPLASSDRSVQLHSCHSPMREVEVLHDQLLALFEADPTLEPRDVLVTVTDMAAYAPCIEAVFDAPESDAMRFPFSIADRGARAENPVADALLRALALVDSRFPATAVLGLLDCEPVRLRFELTESDLALLRDWVSRSGIRWGLDAEDRRHHNAPPLAEHTWRFGLDRLLLGFALPPQGPALFEGILPDEGVEGDLAIILGRFAAFCSALSTAARKIAPLETTAEDWTATLQALLADLCSGEDRLAEAYRTTSEALESIAKSARAAGHTMPLPFRVLHAHVVSLFEDQESGAGFLRGGITFCALKPMRSIPHRVIAMLGLNDDAFPRTARPLAFDLAAAQPKAGDRTLRDDDRHLFLETLLSTRDTLLLSYGGQSPKDNSPRPPSVLIAELLDHLARHFTPVAPYQNTAAQLTTVHGLQAFHPRYFTGDSRLFSYSQENARAAAQAAQPRSPGAPFAQPVAAGAISRDVTISQLTDALLRTARFFAQKRLQLALPFEQPALEDSEPIDIGGREHYGLSSELTESRLAGQDSAVLRAATHAAGALPHGYAGDNAFAEADSAAALIAAAITLYAPGPILPPPAVSFTVGDWSISGTLGLITASAQVRHRAANIHGGDLLSAWLHHLTLCAASLSGYPCRTVVIGNDDHFVFPELSVEVATRTLLPLLDAYARAHAEPLPLFPKTSHAFAEAMLKSGDLEKALRAAENEWRGTYRTKERSENKDEWNALVWRDTDPLGLEFQRLARAVFEPLLATAKKGGTP